MLENIKLQFQKKNKIHLEGMTLWVGDYWCLAPLSTEFWLAEICKDFRNNTAYAIDILGEWCKGEPLHIL
jgi:hypothetical protein